MTDTACHNHNVIINSEWTNNVIPFLTSWIDLTERMHYTFVLTTIIYPWTGIQWKKWKNEHISK